MHISIFLMFSRVSITCNRPISFSYSEKIGKDHGIIVQPKKVILRSCRSENFPENLVDDWL